MANITNPASLIDSINSINTTYSPDTNTNSSAIKLAALQAEYKVVMTMYQNAYQNYITSVSNNIVATHATTATAAQLSVTQAQAASDKAQAQAAQAAAALQPYYAFGSKMGQTPQALIDASNAANNAYMISGGELTKAKNAYIQATAPAPLSIFQAQKAFDQANAANAQATAAVQPYYAYGSKMGSAPQSLLDAFNAAGIALMNAQGELRRSTDSTAPTSSPAYIELPGKQYWGTTGLQEGAVNSKDDCQTMCTNSLKCTGATYDSSLNYCWARSGDGSIVPSSSQKKAIILNSEFPIIVLKMLNDKLIELNANITNELKYAYSSTSKDQITKSHLSNQLAHLIHNKNRINKIINSNNDTVEQELNESELYVTQSYTYYNLYFVIILVLTALYIGNNVFSIITLILLILIITVNTTIFSGIAILLLLFVLFYLKSN